ncbi:MAG: hypothetical protein LPK19_16760, partial [Hymenobacteraceae bacterium]|nr:hypothetical protein [Hymenobacteraceae bacterium]MDX5397905.1 hypothetical protein [Hymenobacteraceae bacterium]MDX5513976.1 hypothetical protein [Hymenobacteraceae bacterium]
FASEMFVNKSFLSVADVSCLDKALHFLEALRQFGHAAGWDICLATSQGTVELSFMGAKIQNELFLTGYQLSTPLYMLQTDPDNQFTSLPGQSANLFQEPEPEEQDLLDELSRVNNELINTKRELIRKNMQLERLMNNKKP